MYKFVLCFSLLFTGALFAQERSMQVKPLKPHNVSKDTITFPRHLLELSSVPQMAQQVYANCSEYASEEHIQLYKKDVERIVVFDVPVGLYPECPLLSSVGLKNKCNASLTSDIQSFSIVNFNPLKYHFPWGSKEMLFFRVDNQPYIIAISPK